MYAAPTQMPIIYQQYLMALGVQEFSLELIGTNNGVEDYTVTYDFNLPDDWDYERTATQTFSKNVSGIIGEVAKFTVDDVSYPINAEITKELIGLEFQYWSTDKYDSGFVYVNGDAYFVNSSMTLYAQWKSV
jgi:hypothetical protein